MWNTIYIIIWELKSRMKYLIVFIVACSIINVQIISKYIEKHYKMILDHNEYILLKKYIKYKKKNNYNHENVILGDDFCKFAHLSQTIVNGRLYGLHQKNVIKDTAYMIDSKTHSVRITNYGMDIIKEYRKNNIKKIFFKILWVIISAFITAFATILLQMLID